MRFFYQQKGELIIELLVAIAIFVAVVSSISFLILDSYVSGRLAREITQANFLAEEGLEAVRSIRDNSWNQLSEGSHGLAISGNNWIFQGQEEDISSQLKEGKRIIEIKNLAFGVKEITSRVVWKFAEGIPQEVKLLTYLTNWTEPLPSYLSQFHYRWRNDDGRE